MYKLWPNRCDQLWPNRCDLKFYTSCAFFKSAKIPDISLANHAAGNEGSLPRVNQASSPLTNCNDCNTFAASSKEVIHSCKGRTLESTLPLAPKSLNSKTCSFNLFNI